MLFRSDETPVRSDRPEPTVDARARSIRDSLAWDDLLLSATMEAFPDYALQLGLSNELSSLMWAGREYAASIVPTRELANHVNELRQRIASVDGDDRLHALDNWVSSELVFYQDPTIHFVDAIEAFTLGDDEIPPPRASGIPEWVEERMIEGFPRDEWRRTFDNVTDLEARDAQTDWAGMRFSLRSTVERRAFRSFWQDLSTRLSPSELNAFRSWVITALLPVSSQFELPMPLPDGSFEARKSPRVHSNDRQGAYYRSFVTPAYQLGVGGRVIPGLEFAAGYDTETHLVTPISSDAVYTSVRVHATATPLWAAAPLALALAPEEAFGLLMALASQAVPTIGNLQPAYP